MCCPRESFFSPLAICWRSPTRQKQGTRELMDSEPNRTFDRMSWMKFSSLTYKSKQINKSLKKESISFFLSFYLCTKNFLHHLEELNREKVVLVIGKMHSNLCIVMQMDCAPMIRAFSWRMEPADLFGLHFALHFGQKCLCNKRAEQSNQRHCWHT